MYEAIKGGLQPQPWHHSIIYTQLNRPRIANIWPSLVGVTEQVHSYAHRHHWKGLKYFIYVKYQCEKESKVVYSLNHDSMASFTLDSDPELPISDIALLV
jgi:hypothetical protein